MKAACFSLLFALACLSCAAASDDKPTVQLSVELRDGSHLVGQALEETLSVHSATLGDLKLPWSGISALECRGDAKEARVTQVNGDTFTVQVSASDLGLQTQFGKTVLPIKLIASLKVTPFSGEPNVTDATQMRLTITLRDGSCIVSTSSQDDTLVFHSGAVGDMKLKWSGVRSITYTSGGTETCKLITRNGDVYQVQFTGQSIRADTSFGKIDLPVKLIRSIAVSAPGGGSARLLGWWKFDDGTGSVAKDSSATPHDGTLFGNPMWTQAGSPDGAALRFMGNGQYVSLGNILQDGYKELSIACWIKRSSSGPETLVERGDWNSTDGIDLCVEGAYAQFGHANGRVTSKTPVQDDQWHQVVGTLAPNDNDSGYVYSIYVDGKLDNTINSQPGLTSTASGWSIGGQGGNWNFQGLMKDVRIYDRALTAGEVESLSADRPNDPASPPASTHRSPGQMDDLEKVK